MKQQLPVLVNDVIISGQGFNFVVTVGRMKAASELVQYLYRLKETHSSKPFPIFDDDEHLTGFVVPSKIASVAVQQRPSQTIDIQKLHADMLKAQTKFYQSHTDTDDDWRSE